MFSVPARISKGQGAGPEKGHFSAVGFSKKACFRDTVKSNKVYNQILTYYLYMSKWVSLFNKST